MKTTEDPALESIRFPIGRFEAQDTYSANDLKELLVRFELAPKRLAVAVRGLTAPQLDTVYRAGGWSARQVVHHVADSVTNVNARFRWALTENEPTIKPYDENGWTALADAKAGPLEPSLEIFTGVSARLTLLLKSFGPREWARRFYHPESKKHFRLDTLLALAAWHHEHHVAHISSLRARAGWNS